MSKKIQDQSDFNDTIGKNSDSDSNYYDTNIESDPIQRTTDEDLLASLEE